AMSPADADIAAGRLDDDRGAFETDDAMAWVHANIAEHDVGARPAADAVSALVERQRGALVNAIDHLKNGPRSRSRQCAGHVPRMRRLFDAHVDHPGKWIKRML